METATKRRLNRMYEEEAAAEESAATAAGAGRVGAMRQKILDKGRSVEGKVNLRLLGKGERWRYVEEERRCELCVRDDEGCRINHTAIEKWRRDMASGKTFRKNPPETGCVRCAEKKKGCNLPATEEMRRKKVEVERGRRGGKRKRDEEVLMGGRMREEEFLREALRLLESIDGRLKRMEM